MSALLASPGLRFRVLGLMVYGLKCTAQPE